MGMSNDPAVNLDKAVQKVAEAAQKGAQVVCLLSFFAPFTSARRKSTVHFDLAEPVPGPSTEALRQGGTQPWGGR